MNDRVSEDDSDETVGGMTRNDRCFYFFNLVPPNVIDTCILLPSDFL